MRDARLGIDDYAGLDVRGKIAAGLGDPAPGIPSEIASHLSSMQAEVAGAHGAVGFISIEDFRSMDHREKLQRQIDFLRSVE